MSLNNTETAFNSKEIYKLAEKPKILIPLWEFILATLLALVFSLLFYFGFFDSIENDSIDFRFKQRGELVGSKDIVLVNITDDCISKLGTWPWPRATHGKLLNILKRAGAKVAAFDIMFTEESLAGHDDDVEFTNSIRHFGKVVLPQIITKKTILDPDSFEMKEVITPERPCRTILESYPYEGFIDLEYKLLNPDGVIRKLMLTKPAGDFYSYIFGLSAACAYLGVEPCEVRGGMKIGADRILPYYRCYEPEAGFPMDSYLINYAGGNAHFDEISYADVMNEKFPQNFFTNRLVLIGTTAKGTSPEDVKFCPYGAIAGVEIHANLLHNILNNRFLKRSTVTNTIILIWVFAMWIAYLLWKNRGFSGNFICLGAAAAWAGLSLIIFRLDVILEITPIVIMVPIQWALTRLVQQFISLSEKNYELAKKVRELAIINEVSKAVSFMGDLGKTLDAVLSRGVQALCAERGSLFMLDDRYEGLVDRSVTYGISGEVVYNENLMESFKNGKGIAGEVFNTGKAKLVSNARKEKSFENVSENNIKSMICVPLMVREDAIGVMNIVNKQFGRFNNDDLQIALTMANQAAVVIEKARLYNLATIDGLTGLVVRRHFQSKMEEEFRRARRYKKPLSYLMTDIDHFKKFNDTYGHQTGDAVLREVAQIVRKSVRETDIAARYGGEEFCVILPETEPEGARQFAERLRQTVEASTFRGAQGEELKVTISIGVSCIPYTNPENATEMIKLADDSLYVCKRNGRNRVELAQPGVVVDTSVPIPRA